MNSNNKTLQGLKKVNDRLLGIETFLLALITILLVAAIVSTFAFLVVFAKLFFDYMMKIFGTTQTSPTMRIPMGWVYLPVFVGIVLAALHEVYMLAACLLGGDKKPAAETDN